jgi:hypothetical protein
MTTGRVERYRRSTRWLHGSVYVAVLVLRFTGVWRSTRRESLAVESAGRDAAHPPARGVGWALLVVVMWVVIRIRGAVGFVVEWLRFRRSDLTWFRRWPAAIVTGRFAWHDGRFDPGSGSPMSRWS